MHSNQCLEAGVFLCRNCRVQKLAADCRQEFMLSNEVVRNTATYLKHCVVNAKTNSNPKRQSLPIGTNGLLLRVSMHAFLRELFQSPVIVTRHRRHKVTAEGCCAYSIAMLSNEMGRFETARYSAIVNTKLGTVSKEPT